MEIKGHSALIGEFFREICRSGSKLIPLYHPENIGTDQRTAGVPCGTVNINRPAPAAEIIDVATGETVARQVENFPLPIGKNRARLLRIQYFRIFSD